MTYKEIVFMARQAGCEESWGGDCFRFSEIELERFAHLVAAAERECCAQLCENQDETDTRYRYDYRRGVLDCADAIRSRGNT